MILAPSRGVCLTRHRVWIEIAVLGTAIAFALAVLFATLGAAAGAAESAPDANQSALASPTQSFEGMVTCSRCGAKHRPNLDRSATTCVRVCVHGGATFALVHDDSVYLLDGEANSLKKLAGQRARVVGVRSGNTIKVASISAVI